LIYRKEKLL
jgi:hypothetical protein